jgi:hypothetical protein
MREKLNESKAAQVGLVIVLAAVVAFMLLGKGSSSSGAEVETAEIPTTETTGETTGETAIVAATAAGAGELPTSVPAQPLPQPFTAAYDADKTVALLVVHDGGIDDKYTKRALREAATVEDVAVIVVPAKQIYRYASVTVGLNVSQLPALIVVRPKSLSHGVPQATVSYGYQTEDSIGQMLRDAAYKGPEDTTYHPG